MKKIFKIVFIAIAFVIVILLMFCKTKKGYTATENNTWMYWYIDDTTIHFSSVEPASLYDSGNRGAYYKTEYVTKSNGECFDNNGNMIGPSAEQRKMITKAVFDNEIRAVYLTGLFNHYVNLIEIENLKFLNTTNVKTMGVMFQHCDSLMNIDLSNFDTQNVTNMSGMFSYCKSLVELDVSKFNTKNVQDMSALFNKCENLRELDVSNFDTTNVTKMSQMFSGCSELKSLDLSSFVTKKVKNMAFMFFDDVKLQTIYVSNNFVTNNLVAKNDNDSSAGNNMFENCVSLIGGNGTEFNVEHIGKEYACIDMENKPGYFTSKS